MILDFHTHIYPDALAPRVIENSAGLNVASYCDGTKQSLLQSMERAGIAASVVLNIATRPGQADHVIDFALATMAAQDPRHPALIPFASLHPRDENWKEQLHRIKKAGFAGIKLHPDYQGFFIDDPSLEPLYREIAALGLIVVFHTGFDVISPDTVHASPERIANVLPLLESGTAVLAHMGGVFCWEKSLELLCGRNVYLDTSFSLFPETVGLMRDMVRKHGPERILFGTDSPWHDQQDSIRFFCEEFAKGFLSREDLGAILGGNGSALLRRSLAHQDSA